jgi:hypothetical protein
MNNPTSFQNLASKPKPDKKRNNHKQQSRDGSSSGQWSNSRTETVLTQEGISIEGIDEE